jgi:hypothetical protein
MDSDMIKLIGLFDQSTETADAIDELHQSNIPKENIILMSGMPYPEEAFGLEREWIRLPYLVLVGALAGLLFGTFLSVITPTLYPLTVGGRPIVTGPPAAVIIFIFTMMGTIVSTFLGVIWEMGFPSFEEKYYNKLVTSGHIAVVIDCPVSQEAKVTSIMEAHGGHHIHRAQRMAL